MGFKDNLVKQKDGSYLLKSKSKKTKDGNCIECGENPITRDLLYQYKAEDMKLVREDMEVHLISYHTHETITPEWCDECKALKGYQLKIKYAKNN